MTTSEWERSLLGAILLAPKSLAAVEAVIDLRDFAEERHAMIFDALVDLAGTTKGRKTLHLVRLKRELANRGFLSDVGCPAYLASLVDGVPRSTPAEFYARGVKERARIRHLIAAAKQLLASYGDEPK